MTSGQGRGKGLSACAKPHQSIRHHPKSSSDIHAPILFNTYTLSHFRLITSSDTSGTERAVALCADARQDCLVEGVLAPPQPHPPPPTDGTAIAAEEELRSGERGGEVVMEEERKGRSVWSRHSQRRGRQVRERRGQCFCFLLLSFFIYLGGEERENKFPLRWRRAKSRPHGSRHHAHARLHAGRSRWHGDLIQLR